jgi:[ribosomal protein S5]-alanine N-acetyltransferase
MVENFLSVETPRLELIAATELLVRADMEDGPLLARLVDRKVPENWPPELVAEARPYFLEDLTRPGNVGWSCWYVALKQGRDPRTAFLIGTAGFKGLPSSDGTVEIGYSILPQYQGKGYASEAVSHLVRWAFMHRFVSRVTARTLPDAEISKRVLYKNGFKQVDEDARNGLLLFQIFREDVPRLRYLVGVRY